MAKGLGGRLFRYWFYNKDFVYMYVKKRGPATRGSTSRKPNMVRMRDNALVRSREMERLRVARRRQLKKDIPNKGRVVK